MTADVLAGAAPRAGALAPDGYREGGVAKHCRVPRGSFVDA